MCNITRFMLLACSMLATALPPHFASAQQYPTRPIRWIVPVPPGATTDILSRLIGSKMSEAWGQQVVVDNRSGGAFVIGTEIVAKAAPDGHTIGIFLTPHVVNLFVLKNLPYDTVRDFQPVTLIAIVPGVMVTNPNVPVASIRDVIALAKAKPGQLNYGSPGAMTSGHLSMELLNLMAGVKILHVPYKGGAPAIVDLLGGQIQFVILGPPTVMAHLKAGRLKAVATTAVKRSPGLPDTPTFAESGLPGYDTYEWYGLFAPARIPRPVLAKLNGEVNRIIALPDVRERMLGLGAIPSGNSPEEFGAFVRREMERWGKVAQQVGLRPD
jgi:tripartite-type tricarboxylate transporter receptor subunit TctC